MKEGANVFYEGRERTAEEGGAKRWQLLYRMDNVAFAREQRDMYKRKEVVWSLVRICLVMRCCGWGSRSGNEAGARSHSEGDSGRVERGGAWWGWLSGWEGLAV